MLLDEFRVPLFPLDVEGFELCTFKVGSSMIPPILLLNLSCLSEGLGSVLAKPIDTLIFPVSLYGTVKEVFGVFTDFYFSAYSNMASISNCC